MSSVGSGGDRRDTRRKPSPQGGTGARGTRYLLPLRPLAHHRGFGIRSEAGDLVIEVHTVPPDALVFEHPAGGERCMIHEATYGLQPLMRISPGGRPAAWVRKVVFGPAREYYTVDLDPVELNVRGCPRDHEYTISHGRRAIATVSRAWVCGPETYGVEVAPGQDEALILAVTVCITLMSGSASAGLPYAPPRAAGPATASAGRRAVRRSA
jgi:uncharacterized protein YxjI